MKHGHPFRQGLSFLFLTTFHQALHSTLSTQGAEVLHSIHHVDTTLVHAGNLCYCLFLLSCLFFLSFFLVFFLACLLLTCIDYFLSFFLFLFHPISSPFFFVLPYPCLPFFSTSILVSSVSFLRYQEVLKMSTPHSP